MACTNACAVSPARTIVPPVSFVIAVIQREVEWLEMKTTRGRPSVNPTDERPHLTVAEWQERRQGRPVLHIDFDAAAIIRDEREQREQEWRKRLEF